MDISPDTELSVAGNLNDPPDIPKSSLESTHGVLEQPPSVVQLSIDVTNFLTIQDDTNEVSNSPKPDKDKDTCNNSHQTSTTTESPEKHLSKSATFPCSDPITIQDDNIKSSDQYVLRSISLPTNLKAVSAMKGSREKRGVAPPEKLRVKWAPEVYDPIPTSVSHVVTSNRSSRHSSKKSSRNKSKNGSKSSRGSKGKEKKQVRKRGGNSSSTGYKSFENEEDEDVFFSHDQFCGSSFLKGYGTKLHLSSVAEAT